MFIEFHIIQNFAPSNLNRDDTGSPKDCEFGGFRRARISSQCIKRAIRETFKTEKLIDRELLASRTKRLIDSIAERLRKRDKSEDDSKRVAEMLLNGVKLTVKDDGKTQYLLFLGEGEINSIADLCITHWDTLIKASTPLEQNEQTTKKGKGGSKEAKKAGQEAVPDEIRKAMLAALDGRRAADLALFGRMLADLPDKNVDAASQVAHAISTNKVSMEFDFYTAVDDLKPEDTQGADMLGTVEFNSACFYRYSNVDLDQLKTNLGGDEELARKTIEAFIRASVAAIPTGKQNSFAAQNPPLFVLAVARRSGLWSLANAFVKPARPTAPDNDLVTNSIRALDQHWGQIASMYGEDQIIDKCYIIADGSDLEKLNGAKVANLSTLVERMLAAAGFDRKGE
ncbi:MAG: type I-E CRISPR-associated protein Cas7/Cse4/CasC [Acidobacteriota bacterium]